MERQNQRLFGQFTDAVHAQEEALLMCAGKGLFKELDSEEWVNNKDPDGYVFLGQLSSNAETAQNDTPFLNSELNWVEYDLLTRLINNV